LLLYLNTALEACSRSFKITFTGKKIRVKYIRMWPLWHVLRKYAAILNTGRLVKVKEALRKPKREKTIFRIKKEEI
jgi:hypothetical protein